MEAINVNVHVAVELSESTKGFIQNMLVNLVSNYGNSTAAPTKPAPATAPTASTAPAAPAKPAPAAPAAAPTTTAATSIPAAPASAPASAPAAASTAPAVENISAPSITIEQVRQALALKVNAHRNEIKDKLTELGAPSVTKLDPAKYADMLNFLNQLG